MKQAILFIALIALVLGTSGFGGFYFTQVEALNTENTQLTLQNDELVQASEALTSDLGTAQIELQDVEDLMETYFTLEKAMNDEYAHLQVVGKQWASGDKSKFDEYMNSIKALIEYDKEYLTLIEENKETLEGFGMGIDAVIKRTQDFIAGWNQAVSFLQNQ